MKSLLIAAVLLSSATAAFAQSYDPDYGTGNVTPLVSNQDGASAFAQADSKSSRAPVAWRTQKPARPAPHETH